jgi:uncharacterized protein (TIGR02145 family)
MKTLSKSTFLTGMVAMLLALQMNAQITLDLKVFLEGPFNGSAMNTGLNVHDLIPLNHPFNVSPWSYGGPEQVVAIPNASIVDWVLVELRETSGDASTATWDKQIQRQAAFLKSNGNIVGLDGSSLITYSGTITNNLYVIIWHRNHLAIMSSGPLTNAGGIYSWDFTALLSKAYLDGQKLIGTGVFGMIGGDSDANGTVETSDKDPGWNLEAGIKAYATVDLNLDSQINNQDKDDIWLLNLGSTAKLPDAVPFTCGGLLVDTRDGQTYNTVQIGTQCWMAESLNIGLITSNASQMNNNGVIEKYCYDNDVLLCQEWGATYQWDEAMQYTITESTQGICPAFWHFPSETEWDVLDDFLGGYNSAGGPMKEAGNNHWIDPNTGATNSSGFTGIASGYSSYQSSTHSQCLWTHNYIWSSTQVDAVYARRRALLYFNAKSNPYFDLKWIGMSVRCVKD